MQKYEMLHEIGNGAAGVVHLVRHKQTGEKYALKIMNKARATGGKKACTPGALKLLPCLAWQDLRRAYQS